MDETGCNGEGQRECTMFGDRQSYNKDQGDQGQIETGCTGFLVSWGSGEFGQHGHADMKCPVEFRNGRFKDETLQGRIKLAACGSSHSIVVKDNDEIFTWGNGTTGQLACPDWGSHLTPFKVNLEPLPSDDVTVTHVACGSRHTMVLLSNGQVHAFGNNFFAQLGYDFRKENYKENQSEPKPLSFLDHWQVVQVACGDKHSMVLLQDGTVAVFGNNTNGQIGDGTRVESVVPKPVDLDAKVKGIACGSNHSLVLTDDGDVYVWGYSKACGHRRHDVLSPQLKMHDRDVVQVAGGGTHSLALTASGRMYSWGFGFDGQLGLGDAILTAARPKLIRHQKLCGRVSFVACAEGYSAAVTAQGHLYIWGKNSHVICASEPANKPYFYPICVNPDRDDQQMTSVHSVFCGTWHLLALAGIPDRQPPEDKESDDIFDESGDEEEEDDGMSSDGSSAHSRRSSVGTPSAAGSSGRPVELSGLSDTKKGPADGTPGTRPFSMYKADRVPTKLTLEEFYTLSDSSHSQDSGQPSPRCQSENTNPASNKEDPCSSPVRKMPTPRSLNESTKDANNQDVEARPSVVAADKLPPNKYTLAPEIAFSSPSPTSEVSAVSESSLKKRMAENLPRNGCSPFKNGEWSTSPRGKRVISPRKPFANLTVVTGSEQEHGTLRSLTPRAASRTKAASLTERANTMFISKSTADHFYLPREPSIVTKQCVSLMDLENLRSGTVFDVGDDSGSSKVQGTTQPVSSSSSSRMDMLFSPGQDSELMDSWGHKSADRTKHTQTMISASDTPSTMLRSTRMQEMNFDGADNSIGSKRAAYIAQQSVFFNTPSPNLGSSRAEDLPLNIPFARSRTMFGATHRGGSKYYRKPGFSQTTRSKLPKPAYLPSTRHGTFVGAFPNGANERQADFSKQKSSTGLEITSSSARLRGIQSQPEPQPSISLTGQRDGVPRRAVHTSAGTTWRARQNTSLTKSLLKDSSSAFPRSNTMLGKSSFDSDSVLMIGRKDIPQPSKPGVEQLRGAQSIRPYQNTLATRSELNLRVNKKS